MHRNFLKEKLQAGTPALGVWSIIHSPVVTEVMATGGLDFQILDMEHGIYDLHALDAGIRACETVGCSPLVRVPGLDPSSIQSALDLGAHGVVIPQIADAKAARQAVQAAKFAPLGNRGFNPFVRAGGYGLPVAERGPKLGNDFGLTVLIIETLKAYEELDEILAIEGLDALYLGVYDMSVAFGCMGETKHPKILKFLESAIPRIRKAGKIAGLMLSSREDFSHYLGMGAQLFVSGVDTHLIRSAIADGVRTFAEARKEHPRS